MTRLATLLLLAALAFVAYVGLRYDACDRRPITTTCETGTP